MNRRRIKSKQLVVVVLFAFLESVDDIFYRHNIMIVILLLFIHLSTSSDQILRTNIGQDVTFSCFFENEFEFNQVSFN